MFASEQIMAALRAKPSLAKLKSMMVVNYHRETVAALLQLVKRRVYLYQGSWDDVACEFLGIIEDDRSRLVGMNNYRDLCLQLHLYGVHTVPPLESDWQARFGAKTPAKIFKNWTSVPPVLCIVLTVPRKSLQVLLLDTANTGTPTLQCILTAQGIHSNTYSAIHTVWGSRVITPNSNDVTLKEDEKGINGTSGLVVWFWASSRILEFENTSVNLAIKSTPQSTLMFAGKLGMALTIFSAKLDDKKHVRLLTYCPPLANEEPWTNQTAIIRFANPPPNRNIRKIMAGVSRGPRSRDVISLTARIPLRSADKGKGLLVSVVQTLPCTMDLSVGYRHQQSVAFPYPVLDTRYKMQRVKESNSVEITVPVSEPSDSGGYYLNRAPILRNNNAYSPWNLHHIYANRMPLLNLEDSSQLDWLGLHAVLQLSDPEKPIQSGPTAILADVKDSIFTLLLLCAGIRVRRSRYIGLCEPENGGIYAILLVGGLRLDLAAFTVVIDTALVPLSTERMPALIPGIQALQSTSSVTQIVTRGEVATAWKKLLPAYVERCRTWSHKTDCEYTIRGKIPLSIEMKENPICTCGEGIGFEGPEWKVDLWDGLLPYATRAAISPLFLVSYMGIPIAGHLRAPGWNFKHICILVCVVLLVYRFWAR
ncbi:hypothetical protein FRC09_000085 [Ceratobasidium sp. 395]|nr:hypothetical protein FRC09_000085 [Ceratobasidium sp. 395]